MVFYIIPLTLQARASTSLGSRRTPTKATKKPSVNLGSSAHENDLILHSEAIYVNIIHAKFTSGSCRRSLVLASQTPQPIKLSDRFGWHNTLKRGESCEFYGDSTVDFGGGLQFLIRLQERSGSEQTYIQSGHLESYKAPTEAPEILSGAATLEIDAVLGVKKSSLDRQIKIPVQTHLHTTMNSKLFKVTIGKDLYVVKEDRSLDKSARRRTIKREVEALKKLNHQNVVEFVEVSDLYHRFAVRYIGPDLGSFTNDKGKSILTPQQCKCLLSGILQGLEHIHAAGLAHNDIKPGNICVVEDRAVIIDLGICKSVNEPASTGGTPRYVPPEYLSSEQRGAPGDIWAVAITYLWMTGIMPSQHGEEFQIFGIHAERSQSEREKMKRWLRTVKSYSTQVSDPILQRMLVWHPWERPTAAMLVRDMQKVHTPQALLLAS
ncbi:kinase-like domain-containing protein [Clohesyomyces aquaticus]|uniref:Kinase-like domain-containing protein n=1 Tax=Clohesyomyces aquaticus TaxID=1231657 RepID=A0A1Y1YV71_9PLEO|nr:kinase-like domain-containing protein [Clohesyomyces aquaticus]